MESCLQRNGISGNLSKGNREKVAGVILAAGGSSRFGSLKQTLPWGDQNFVNAVLKTARLAGLDPLLIVLGNRAEEVRDTITDEDVEILINPDWEAGQSSSLKLAVKHLDTDLTGAIFLMCDQPHLTVHFLASIVEKGKKSAKVVVPYINDRRTSPVFFPASCFDNFNKLTGDEGGMQIMSECPVVLFPWLDEMMAMDIDTLEDYRRVSEYFGKPYSPDDIV
ncbi:MAG: nucleotidyltransferase family protein [Anaerolineaceae bacterium]